MLHGPQKGYRVHWPPCCPLLVTAFRARAVPNTQESGLGREDTLKEWKDVVSSEQKKKKNIREISIAPDLTGLEILNTVGEDRRKGGAREEEGQRRGREEGTTVISCLSFASDPFFFHPSHQNHDIGAAPFRIEDHKA